MVVDYGNVLDTSYGFRVSAACNMVNLMDIKEIKSNNMSKETKDAISLIDTINELHNELNKAKEVIKDANDFKAWIKESVKS